MERILTVCQMQKADNFTINNLGVSQEDLVFRAGESVASVIKEQFFGGRVLVCVGKGNNGKDGLVIADILSKAHGFSVKVFDSEKPNYDIFDRQFDLIIDCLFGVGLNRQIEGKYKEIIDRINAINCYKIACDIPSGINGDNGKVMGVAVKCDMTVAIGEYKVGHFLGDGIDYTGKLVCKDIGISVWDDKFIKRIDDRDAKKCFEKPNRNVHKGNFGKTCIIGGSEDFTGSAILSANSLTALKSGVGYTYLCVPKNLFNAYVGKNPECILMAFDEDFSTCFEKVLSCDTIAVGMGMGNTLLTYKIVSYLLENFKGTLIIDADGLNSLSRYGISVLKDKKCSVILTPHIGEFARLSGQDKEALTNNIISSAVAFAKEYNVKLAVKSAVSIITDGEEIYLNTTGCSAMARAGSGDVLAGLIAGTIARNSNEMDGLVSALYMFGKAGEKAQDKGSVFTVTASEIIEQFHSVIKNLQDA